MYLYEVGLAATVVVVVHLAISAYLLLIQTLSPRFVESARDRFAGSPVKSVLLGVPIALLLFIANAAALSAPAAPVRMLGFVTTGLSIGLAFAGASGLVATVASGLGSARDRGRAWPAFLRGATVVLLASLLPLLGWFVIFPVVVFGGLGTSARLLIRPAREQALAATLSQLSV